MVKSVMRVVSLALLIGLGLVTPSLAAPALTGSTFGFGQLPMPRNSIPAAGSGYSSGNAVGSPLSGNGRYLLFISEADTLDPDVEPDSESLFRKDLQTGKVILVGRADGVRGRAAVGELSSWAISGNGRYIAFTTNDPLDPADTDDLTDAYLRDVTNGSTRLMSPGADKYVSSVDISGDGAFIAFSTASALSPTDVGTGSDVYRVTVSDGTTELVSMNDAGTASGDKDSGEPDLSYDGRWVAFSSRASDLVPSFVDANGNFSDDVFARDMTAGDTRLISTRNDAANVGGNGRSGEPMIAGNPQDLTSLQVAFTSEATDIGPAGEDLDTAATVYVRSMDQAIQPAELISKNSAGASADSRAHTPSISSDGSRVVFTSDAENLGPTPDYYGVYLRNLNSSTTTLVSASNGYAVNGSISSDGRNASWMESGKVTADNDPNLPNVFVRQLPSGKIRLGSRPPGNGPFLAPVVDIYDEYQGGKRINASGRFAVFSASSPRLPGGGDTPQIYRRDLRTGAVVLVSRKDGKNGAAAETYASDPTVSGDGDRVAFVTFASLVPDDSNGVRDVYVRSISAGKTWLVSRAAGEGSDPGDASSHAPAISANGKKVAFTSEAANFVGADGSRQAWLRDMDAGSTELISRADGPFGTAANEWPSVVGLSRDGAKVVFHSRATNLLPDDLTTDNDIYMRDPAAGVTTLLSRAPGPGGAKLVGGGADPAISADGKIVAFMATDDAAVPGTGPWTQDQIVVRRLEDGSNQLASVDADGNPGSAYSSEPSLSADGRVVAFVTRGQRVVPEIQNPDNISLVAIRDLERNQTSGPPRFGREGSGLGAYGASISDNGNCVLFTATGHNRITGPAGDYSAGWIYARQPGCQDPKLSVAKVTALKVKPKKAKYRKTKKAKVSFGLNLTADVLVRVERAVAGKRRGKRCVAGGKAKKKAKKCIRWVTRGKVTGQNLAPGAQTVVLKGKLSPRKLKPGRYRVLVTATTTAGSSKAVAKPWKVKS